MRSPIDSILSKELNTIVSSYLSSDEIQGLNGQAGGLLTEIPEMFRERAKEEAAKQTTLVITNQRITTIMLLAIKRDFPVLTALTVKNGSTLDGSDFSLEDIEAVLPNLPSISGAFTPDELNGELLAKIVADIHALTIDLARRTRRWWCWR